LRLAFGDRQDLLRVPGQMIAVHFLLFSTFVFFMGVTAQHPPARKPLQSRRHQRQPDVSNLAQSVTHPCATGGTARSQHLPFILAQAAKSVLCTQWPALCSTL